MLVFTKVELLCDHCGEELRFVEGTSITLADAAAIYNLHHCHARQWGEDTVSALPDFRRSGIASPLRIFKASHTLQSTIQSD